MVVQPKCIVTALLQPVPASCIIPARLQPAPAPCIIPALLLRHASLPPSYSPAPIMHHNASFLPSHNSHQHHSCPQPGATSCIVMHRYRPPYSLATSSCILMHHPASYTCPPTALHPRYCPPTACIMHCYRPHITATSAMHHNASFLPSHIGHQHHSCLPTAWSHVMHCHASPPPSYSPAPAPCIVSALTQWPPVLCIIRARLQPHPRHASIPPLGHASS
jgi:hypothetical protein